MVKIIKGYNLIHADREFTQLTAPGNTASEEVIFIKNHTFQVVVASINTNVIVRAEGSLDNTNFFNLADDGADTTITANGTTLMHKPTFSAKFVRLNFVSELGGTTATIDVKYLGSN